MASRKEQKEALRKAREERDANAQAEQRRRQMVGGAVALVAVVVGLVILTSGGGDAGGDKATDSSSVLPGGGKVPDQKISDLSEAAKAAGCTLQSFKGKSREHTGDLAARITYDSNPPTEGKHFQVPADDGAYDKEQDIKTLVHTLEHGRVIIWFKPGLPAADRANLKALFDEDNYHMVLTPDKTMKYPVAASAWNAASEPNGTGRLLACEKFTPEVYDALHAFKDEHRDNGPENVP